jgi:hypothetical protein
MSLIALAVKLKGLAVKTDRSQLSPADIKRLKAVMSVKAKCD